MTIIEQLTWLLDKENGLGIATNLMAKYCNTTPTSLRNVVQNKYNLTDKMRYNIERGIKDFYNDITIHIGG